ncbi:hypothetical protein [Enterobacter phage EspM4VN]|uniref:DUF7181 domain-containing protein n=1 Tax=Enterobacter phage EspM4VN TaxID=2137745 RepID=A0A4P2WVD2_9CAUD|nr:hypothetical protein HYP11_gp065 [Enterobacter phage EspM4VN]BBK03743.1 hypothetical protein [Enterobacter phage EspM4VN]
MTTKPTYEELAHTVLTFDDTLKTLYKVLGKNPTSESGNAVNLLLLLNPLWDIDATVAALRDPNAVASPRMPNQDELAAAVVHLDDAWSELFAQTCSNPVTNAWGKPVNFTEVNNFREKASGIVYRTRLALKGESAEGKQEAPASTGIQNYLENFDQYSFTDLLLRDLINTERRRQEKNCPVVQSDHEIEEIVREELNGTYSPIDLAVMIVQALAYAAKGETK